MLLSNKVKIVLAVSLVALIVLVVCFRDTNKGVTVSYHQSRFGLFAPDVLRAVAKTEDIKAVNLRHVYGGVLPHHIPTTIPILVKFYERLAKTQKVKRFIVIGPDHISGGRYPISLSAQAFFTPFGQTEPSVQIIEELERRKLAFSDEDVFDPEHSVGSQVLLISKFFPDAEVVPIILRSDVKYQNALALGKVLATFLDDETVIIASVDFSHYLTADQARPIDTLSGEVLKNLDIEAAHLVKADSSQSMAAFMKAMEERGATKVSDMFVLNTNDLTQNSDYTTGYVTGYFGI